MTLASVIVSAYNSARYLPTCIESILQQTEQSFQLIIINDGSSDQTLNIARYYAQEDSRIMVIDQPNSGVSVARNNGVAAAVGEYVLFLDSDDWVEPNMIEDMVSSCKSTNSQVGIAGMIVDFHDKKETLIKSEVRNQQEYIIKQGIPLPEYILTENFINLLGFTWNKIYQRSLFKQMEDLFEEGLHLYEDVDFNVRVLSKAESVVLIPGAFVHYIQRPGASLVRTRNSDFLSVCYRAILNIDFILEAWHVTPDIRECRKFTASGNSLWAALYAAIADPNPRKFLLKLLDSKESNDLITFATSHRLRTWKGRFATIVISHGWFSLGLAAAAIVHLMKKYKAIFLTLTNKFR